LRQVREIVAEILAEGSNATPAVNIVPLTRSEPEASPGCYDAFSDAAEPEPTPAETNPPKAKASKAKAPTPAKKVGNPGHGDDHWTQLNLESAVGM
jgi:hypothetical protein